MFFRTRSESSAEVEGQVQASKSPTQPTIRLINVEPYTPKQNKRNNLCKQVTNDLKLFGNEVLPEFVLSFLRKRKKAQEKADAVAHVREQLQTLRKQY